MLRCRGLQVLENVLERKAVLRTERQDDGIFRRRRLELEVEAAAEALAERETPRAIDAAAERRVEHQLHSARFVEEPLQDETLLRGDRAENLPRRPEILDDQAGARLVESDVVDQPLNRRRGIVQPVGDVLPQ